MAVPASSFSTNHEVFVLELKRLRGHHIFTVDVLAGGGQSNGPGDFGLEVRFFMVCPSLSLLPPPILMTNRTHVFQIPTLVHSFNLSASFARLWLYPLHHLPGSPVHTGSPLKPCTRAFVSACTGSSVGCRAGYCVFLRKSRFLMTSVRPSPISRDKHERRHTIDI